MNPLEQTQEHLFLRWKNRSIDFMKAYQEQDVLKMLSYCASICMVEFIPLGDAGKGLASKVGKTTWETLIDCFPNIDNTVHTASKNNGTVRCEVTIYGRQAKDFAGIICKDKEFEEDHIFIFKVNNLGFIEHLTIDWDHDHFVAQLTA